MSNYGQHFSARRTPQSEQAQPAQVKNNAGGHVFQLDKWKRLDRWLILGAEGATYYATEQKLENARTVIECLAEDGARTVSRIVEISTKGRAPKNDPAIFALAMAAGDGNIATRTAALVAIPSVCRIGTHLFHFARDVENFRRWGRGLRSAVARWYTEKPVEKLAYDLLKYQQRDGWGHRDLLRLSHPKAQTVDRDASFRWAVGAGLEARDVRRGKSKDAPVMHYGPFVQSNLPKLLAAYDELKASPDTATTAKLIREHGFTHEMVPSDHKNSVDVWEALLEDMPQTALVRNLAKMTSVGLFTVMGQHTRKAASMIADVERLKRARVHPIALLSALRVYQQGHGEKGSLTWTPMREIVDALDEAFYLAFQAVEPTGKAHLLALDVSGSMDSGLIAGCPGLTPRVASAAMAMVTARVEKNWACCGFTSSTNGGYGGKWGGGSPGLKMIDISPRERLDDVIEKIRKLPMGGTDCALPMLAAIQQKWEVDIFVTYTDNETWAGDVHPFQALREYREKTGRDAKNAVIGMTASAFTIADPSDAGMLDFVGFDSSAPAILADFARQ